MQTYHIIGYFHTMTEEAGRCCWGERERFEIPAVPNTKHYSPQLAALVLLMRLAGKTK